MDLATASSVLRLLADPTRVRLLALLEHEELTVAELAACCIWRSHACPRTWPS
jgi:hypothetical protein